LIEIPLSDVCDEQTRIPPDSCHVQIVEHLGGGVITKEPKIGLLAVQITNNILEHHQSLVKFLNGDLGLSDAVVF